MNMKIIDEDWIDQEILDMKIMKKGSSVAKFRFDDKIEILEMIKEQLQPLPIKET